jgi:hypothetical protein
LSGGKDRETEVRRLRPVIDNLVKKGYEPIVRDKLAKLDLSRTEIEDLIHPMSNELSSKIGSLPKASADPEKNEAILADFMKKNLGDGSLLVLRHKLMKEKGYDWQQTSKAFEKAVGKGLPVNQSQATELTEFTSQPPRDSLVDIFSDWGRFVDYLQGAK